MLPCVPPLLSLGVACWRYSRALLLLRAGDTAGRGIAHVRFMYWQLVLVVSQSALTTMFRLLDLPLQTLSHPLCCSDMQVLMIGCLPALTALVALVHAGSGLPLHLWASSPDPTSGEMGYVCPPASRRCLLLLFSLNGLLVDVPGSCTGEPFSLSFPLSCSFHCWCAGLCHSTR